ncbi:HTH-type transcriptional regulator GltC [Fictibacillus macauensis ZFHKF-1]|uniref:HTH-type transcriptional regulator GltC n=1 Tax=Fictibacillus macauensis ZFHKF-1 TaxID=1196324 RepID=I8UIT9_9BACL|nr:LysR family transcriptional regulator [Fictibacillus macauensis]EIT86748.1 HTH-type transcriptional regulator GltC [Fictibacillus macauensis ZFHKF-1]
MELRQLYYFMEVAHREHVSEAAHHLHVAQSAVSRQIANLEKELGVDLFEREGRNVKLTPVGKIFLNHIQTALQGIDYAKKQVQEYLDPERGSIKIGFPTSLASHLLPTVISAFKQEHPHIAFLLRQGSYHFLTEAVAKGEISLAFIGPVPSSPALTEHILFTEKVSALLPAHHPFAEKEELILNDLRHEPFVMFPKGYILHTLVADACRNAGFTPNIACEGEDLDAIKGLVTAGMGITLLPDSSFYETTPRYTVRKRIAIPIVERTVGIISSATRKLAPSEKVFYDFATAFFATLEQYQ